MPLREKIGFWLELQTSSDYLVVAGRLGSKMLGASFFEGLGPFSKEDFRIEI